MRIFENEVLRAVSDRRFGEVEMRVDCENRAEAVESLLRSDVFAKRSGVRHIKPTKIYASVVKWILQVPPKD